MHFIIVEDLETDREKLSDIIKEDFYARGQNVDLSFYGSGEDFLAHYHAGICDAVFMDIMMDGISGMDAANQIRRAEPRLPIIFTTTEPDFALEGFGIHAMDYLVKPLDAAKVSWCLSELREYLAAPSSIEIAKIDGRGHSVNWRVALDDILYGQYQNHRIDIHTVSGKVSTRASFRDFVGMLPQTGRFCVCARGLVVNLSHVMRVEGGILYLKNGEMLLFSEKDQEKIRQAFFDWTFTCSRKGGWA